MYKRFFCLPLSIFIFVLTLLPGGAACNVTVGPEEVRQEVFSYFDTTYFGYTNFAPFFAAVAACIALVFLIVYCCTQWYWFGNAAKHFLFGGIVFAVMPLLFGVTFVSTIGILIAAAMIVQLALLHFLIKECKSE